ncbi:MAG: complex I subunit 5 family protein [Lachnospiraceae bacterium]|nr:complex I subunit 5 family protein [Lachnospiraceae bacterium]
MMYYFSIPYVCGMGLNFTLDGFRMVYCSIAAFMWLMTACFSKEYFSHYTNKARYHIFSIITFIATEGVFLSADFYTTFVFFEIMSLASYVWVAYDEKKASMRAAATYMAVAVIGGLVMLMGVFLLYNVCGTLRFDELKDAYSAIAMAGDKDSISKMWAAGLCMLFGFGAKAGAFPLHIWLPKAHPVAPAPASALLSGILTKAGMFGILILSCYIFAGNGTWASLILVTGVITMALGAVLALFSIDLKRTLACSSVSQIGFILVGVGTAGLLEEENALAIRGALMHMANHSLIKLTLFMAAGAVFMNVHKLDLNDIRGFGRGKKLLNYIFLMGALGIGGMPLFNGYISKTLMHEGIVEYRELIHEGEVAALFSATNITVIEWIFLISGGLTVAYMTKLYICIFVEKNKDAAIQAKYDALNGKYMTGLSAFALTLSATVLPILGMLPGQTLSKMAELSKVFLNSSEMEAIRWFSFTNLKGALISISIGALIYVIIVRNWMIKDEEYLNRWSKLIDLENLIYRPLLLTALPFVFGIACRVLDSLVDGIVVFLRKTIYKDSKIPQELEEGNYFTHIIGAFLNWLQDVGNVTVNKKNIKFENYEHKTAAAFEDISESAGIVKRSLSFGLIIFCIGLLLTMAYILSAK